MTAPPGGFRYHAFISYQHADLRAAKLLHRRLETFKVPRRLVREKSAPRSLRPIFRDREELRATGDLRPAIEAALRESRFLIVLCSPAAARSPWVEKEVRAFCALSPDRAERVLPFFLRGEPNASFSPDPGTRDLECYPPALRTPPERLGSGIFPLAGDVRGGSRGVRREALLRIAATMLGVEFDDLRRRAATRAARRNWALGAFAALLVATFAWLAWDARRQRDEAVAFSDRLTHGREQAEALIKYLSSTLSDALQASGQVGLLGELDDRVRAYNLSFNDPRDPWWLQSRRGQLVTQQARALAARGDWERARRFHEDAAVLLRRAVTIGPAAGAGALELRASLAECLTSHSENLAALERHAEAARAAEEAAGLVREEGRVWNQSYLPHIRTAATLAAISHWIQAGEPARALELGAEARRRLPVDAGLPAERMVVATLDLLAARAHRQRGDFGAARADALRGRQAAVLLSAAHPGDAEFIRLRAESGLAVALGQEPPSEAAANAARAAADQLAALAGEEPGAPELRLRAAEAFVLAAAFRGAAGMASDDGAARARAILDHSAMPHCPPSRLAQARADAVRAAALAGEEDATARWEAFRAELVRR